MFTDIIRNFLLNHVLAINRLHELFMNPSLQSEKAFADDLKFKVLRKLIFLQRISQEAYLNIPIVSTSRFNTNGNRGIHFYLHLKEVWKKHKTRFQINNSSNLLQSCVSLEEEEETFHFLARGEFFFPTRKAFSSFSWNFTFL